MALWRVPISAVAALAGAAFMDNDKINKHALALAVAKHDTICAFVFQALNNNNVSDADFKQITHEMQKYNELTEFSLKFDEKTKLIWNLRVNERNFGLIKNRWTRYWWKNN